MPLAPKKKSAPLRCNGFITLESVAAWLRESPEQGETNEPASKQASKQASEQTSTQTSKQARKASEQASRPSRSGAGAVLMCLGLDSLLRKGHLPLKVSHLFGAPAHKLGNSSLATRIGEEHCTVHRAPALCCAVRHGSSTMPAECTSLAYAATCKSTLAGGMPCLNLALVPYVDE